MDYDPKLFDLKALGGHELGEEGNIVFAWHEEDRQESYVFTPMARLTVNVALATKRPLLVMGEPGSGKTTLALAVARASRRQYYKHTVTSRTQATDLLWNFDTLRRLNDASNPRQPLRPLRNYVQPGAVWWGFDPVSAAACGLGQVFSRSTPAIDTDDEVKKGAVVLVDEIDKADPDVPNDLLEPFDIRQFIVRETNERIEARRDVFLVLTTNGERELPPAFLRRCVILTLGEPKADWFEQVAIGHFPCAEVGLRKRLAETVTKLREQAEREQIRKPSTAEFLDALRVCMDLRIDEGSSVWPDIVSAVLLKTDRRRVDKRATGGSNAAA